MEPCVASSRMFLALNDINTLLLPLVEKFALEQAWCLTSKNFPRLAEAIGGKQSQTVLDFCQAAFSVIFFFFSIQYTMRMHIIGSPRKKAKSLHFVVSCTAEQAFRLLMV